MQHFRQNRTVHLGIVHDQNLLLAAAGVYRAFRLNIAVMVGHNGVLLQLGLVHQLVSFFEGFVNGAPG